MARWLFKEEPSHYSYEQLERDGSTLWDGVANALALQHLRKIRRGDAIFFYQSGKDKAIVGVMEATADATPAGAVTVRAVRRLARPVTLAAVKADPAFATWELTRLPRLSIMPVSAKLWQRVLRLGG